MNRIAPILLVSVCASPLAAATSLSNLVMWENRDAAPSQVSLSQYHGWLLHWCEHTPPKRLVLYVSSPCIGAPFATFYDPTASPTNGANPANFVDFLDDLAAQSPTVEVEVMLDRSSFPAGGPTSPCWSGAASTQPALTLPSTWSNLPLALDWLGALHANAAVAGGSLAGITLDPELGGGTPGTTCVPPGNHAVAISYQQLIDWIDAWKHLNNEQSLRSGMTFEIDSATFTKLNVSDLPMSSELQAIVAAASPELQCQLSGGYPSWRPGASDPLLQSAYMQIYVACGSTPQGEILQGSSFWRWQNEHGCETGVTPTPRSAAEAAESLRLNLTQSPGSPGPGTLMAAFGGGTTTFTGAGTRFTDWSDYTRVAAVQPDGTTIPSSAEGGKWTFQTASSDTAATGYGPDVGTAGLQLPYRYSELLMNWFVPHMSPAMTTRIWPMFSAEKDTLLPFFGYWTQQEFLAFIDAFAAATDGSDLDHAIYASDATTPIAAPANWAIYDLKHVCDAWGLGPYPGTTNGHCAGDYNWDGMVGIADLLHLLQYWGTPEADLDFDGTTSIDDLQVLIGNFGLTNC